MLGKKLAILILNSLGNMQVARFNEIRKNLQVISGAMCKEAM
jgi:DNA-binding HxlR family transcriptional regulator